MNSSVKIRYAALEDAAALAGIYAPYVRNTAITFEFTPPDAEQFRERMAHSMQQYPYLVAQKDGELVGYAYAGQFKDRAAYAWAVETTVYVRSDRKHCGVGKALYGALAECLRTQGILNMNACIAVPQQGEHTVPLDSVAFHEQLGFQTVARIHACGFKQGSWYDIVWMEKFLGAHEDKPPELLPFPAVRALCPQYE